MCNQLQVKVYTVSEGRGRNYRKREGREGGERGRGEREGGERGREGGGGRGEGGRGREGVYSVVDILTIVFILSVEKHILDNLFTYFPLPHH